MTSVCSFAQLSHCKVADIEELKKNGIVVAISDDGYTNKEVQEIMTKYWSASKFTVIKRSGLGEYIKANPTNFVLTYFNDLDVHNFNANNTNRVSNGTETGKIQFLGDCIILAKNLARVNSLRLTDAMMNSYIDFEMRIVNEQAEFIRQIGSINSILTVANLQDTQIGGWKIPTINQKEFIEKELWIADIDISKKEEEIAKMKDAYLPYKYKVVTKAEIAKAIIEKRKDVVYLARAEYKSGINLCFVQDPEKNSVLFFVKEEGRFNSTGLENIKNNKPYQN
jgi:hypothetical protein